MATLPSPATFTAGELVTAAKLNTNVRDAINFLLNPPHCSVYTTTATSVPVTTATLTSFTNEYRDNDSMFTTATPTVVTIKTPGLYQINARGNLTTSASGYRLMTVLVNGAAVFRQSMLQGGAGAVPALAASAALKLAVNDTISLEWYHTNSSALSFRTTTDERPSLDVTWIGTGA